jgi:hypothetical protein
MNRPTTPPLRLPSAATASPPPLRLLESHPRPAQRRHGPGWATPPAPTLWQRLRNWLRDPA